MSFRPARIPRTRGQRLGTRTPQSAQSRVLLPDVGAKQAELEALLCEAERATQELLDRLAFKHAPELAAWHREVSEDLRRYLETLREQRAAFEDADHDGLASAVVELSASRQRLASTLRARRGS